MREVLIPSLIALFALTFVLLIGQVFDLMNILMHPGVNMLQAALGILSFIPMLLVMSTPMALLIGGLIGVGRLMLDREILAMRAGGISLLSVFFPLLTFGLIISFVMAAFSMNVIPKLLVSGLNRMAEVQLAIFRSLEPGQLHDRLTGKDDPYSLYFRERDSSTDEMLGVLVFSSKRINPNEKNKDAPRQAEVVMISAASGWIDSRFEVFEEDENETPKSQIVLRLNDGAVHQLSADPDDREYTTIWFKSLEKRLVITETVKGSEKTMTHAELKALINQAAASDQESLDKHAARAKATIIERLSFSLANFIFLLVGIPLAIWMRPSGKSWGIIFAIALMLIYYVLMKMGLTVVEARKPYGELIAYTPSILFILLSVVLWRHSLRSG